MEEVHAHACLQPQDRLDHMRFAYIDSQGNEVAIPSEDALRLRIELGAISEGTSFYDEGSGRWAPAGEHEIFRRLRGDVVRRDAPGSPDADAEVEPAPDMDAPPWPEARRAEPREVSIPAPAVPPRAPEPPGVPIEAAAADAALHEPAPDEPVSAHPEPGGDAEELFDFGDFGALDLEEEGPVPVRSTSPPPDSPPSYGDVDPPSPGVRVDPDHDPWTVPGRDPWGMDAGSTDAGDAAASPMGGVGFGDEPPPGWEPAPAAPRPHPFEAEDDMPEWLRNDPEFGETARLDGPESFPTREGVRERVAAGEVAPEPAAPRRRPPPPPLPRPKPRGALVAGLAVVVAAVGGAAWFMTRDGGADDAPPVVELPPLAPSLEPVLRSAVGAALPALVDSLRALPARTALAEEVHAEWLGGRYMANATQFSDVRLYWESMGRYVQIMQAREGELFAAALSASLDTIPLPSDDRAAVEVRAEAGFEAAAPDREAVYDQLRAVVDAALGLQVFLEQNEANIDYEPAVAGLSRDPVLEAVPLTESLGEEMWNRVAEITSALDALGFLDRVTTDRLLEVFFDKLSAVPIR